MNRSGTAREELKDKKLFVLDLDGTFYLGDRILDGSLDFIRKVRRAGKAFVFFTNNSSRDGAFYQKKLAGMGAAVEKSDIITSGDVTIRYLRREYPGKRVFLLSTPLLERSFREAGIRLTQREPDLVVLGFDTTLCYEKVAQACSFIAGGAPFIATHPDINCPTEDGFIPDCGAITAMISASTGVRPKVLGKPGAETIVSISEQTGCERNGMVFVGDRLYTDIAIGANNGVTTVLVLTGETSESEAACSPIRPDFIFSSLGRLAQEL